MAKNYILDEDGRLMRILERVSRSYKQDFELLEEIRFLCVWRLNEPEYDKDGLPVEGMARKLPTRERDIYGYDVEIRIHQDSWKSKSTEQRRRLLFRILLSIHVEQDEELAVLRDEDGRIVFRIDPPDVVVKAYSRELEEYGVPSRYQTVVSRLASQHTKE